MATAHVPQHAFGGAYYALKAIATADPTRAEVKVTKELNWQVQHIPTELRQEVLKRVIIQKRNDGIVIRIQKDKDF